MLLGILTAKIKEQKNMALYIHKDNKLDNRRYRKKRTKKEKINKKRKTRKR